MKKTFKLKALVLFVAVIMALTIVPNVRANEKQDLIDSAKYTNITGYSKNSAASNVEVTATATRDGAAVEDLGNLKAGDVITVKFSMSKLPGAGLWDFSWKIGWLDANLEIVRTDLNEPGEEVDEGLKDVPYINPLAVGQKVNLQNDYFVSEDEVIHDAEKDAGVKYVSIGATASSRAATTAGDIFELQFVVKKGASGPCEVFFMNEEKYDSIDIVGATSATKKADGPYREATTNRIDTYVTSNANELVVKVPVDAVEANPAEFTMDISDGTPIELMKKDAEVITVTPDNCTDEMSWSIVSGDDVVSVSDGTVTALKPGTAVVRCTVGTQHVDVTINVIKSVKKLDFENNNRVTIDFQESKDLSTIPYTVDPEDAYPAFDASKLTFEVADSSIATLSGSTVTGAAKGTTQVTVKYDGKEVATIDVVVTKKVKSISLDKDTVEIYKGKNDTVKVTTEPADAEFASLKVNNTEEGNLYTADVDVAKKEIKITGDHAGTTTVTVVGDNGENDQLKKTLTITVKENPIVAAKISDGEREVLRGETLELDGDYVTQEEQDGVADPHETTDDKVTVTWESSDETVATVDKNGKVTGVKEGTATITLTINGKTATTEVTVKENHVTGIELNEKALEDIENREEINPGDKIEIPFTVNPEDTTDTDEEIKDAVKALFDEDAVDVEITYENGKGKVTITFKKAAESTTTIYTGELSDEDQETLDQVLDFIENGVVGKDPETGKDILFTDLTEEEQEQFLAEFDDAVAGLYDKGVYIIYTNVTDPEPEPEEAPETGDMPVALMGAIMLASVAGLTVSKKILVK